MLKGKLPSEVVNERQQYVNSLKQFVEDQKKKLKEVLQKLNLTEESLSKVEPKQLCPYDSNHFVPEKSFKKHVERCRLLRAGYQTDELPSQLSNTDFCYEGKNSFKIEIDESLMNKILWDDCVQKGEVYTGHRAMPSSHMEENRNLNQNDRLAIYHYVVGKSREAGKVIEVDKSDELLTTDWGHLVKKGLLDAQNNEKYSSKLEQLAALRDLKRRRQSYRAKNVHITKKSYTEIIREVIVNQMEVLVPADTKTHVTESDNSEKYKSKNRDRERRERNGDDDGDRGTSHSRRHRSRSRSRDRDRRRYKYNDEYDKSNRRKDDSKRKDEEDRRSKHRDRSNSPSGIESRRGNVDLELVKSESLSTENLFDHVTESSSKETLNQIRDMGEVNSRSSSVSQRSKRSRSRSSSSSPSSDGDHHHHRHHKKRKHKKKSKHSKKHSKKHKR